MEEQKVSWNFKNYFLTYAQAEFTREGLAAFLLRVFKPYEVRRWVVSVELHQDGGRHYHALFCLLTKCHTRNVRRFDFEGKHPNVRAPGNMSGDIERVYYYIIKHGDYIEEWEWYDGPLDYRRRKGDVEEFVFDKQMGQRECPFPFERPDEVLCAGIDPDEKRRHLWFYGAADWGKTTWVNETFANKKIYMRPADDLYPFEGYRGEPIVIYDDVLPKGKEELTCVTNTWRVWMCVYGRTRYTRRYWPLDEPRMVIVLANFRPEWEGEGWFDSRFRVIRL